VEFTKTRPTIVKGAAPPYARRGSFYPLEPYKTDKDINYYFDRANGLMPIRSSIPEAIKNSATNAEASAASSKQAESSAEAAALSAKEAARSAIDATTKLFRLSLVTAGGILIAAFGILIALVVGLHQYFGQIQANVQTTQSLAGTIRTTTDQARSDAGQAIAGEVELRRELEFAKVQRETIRTELLSLRQEVERLRQPSAPSPRSPK
jgi:hypothetical protein